MTLRPIGLAQPQGLGLAQPLLCRHEAIQPLLEHTSTSGHARRLLGWPKICGLAHGFLWEYS
jgi:hypothetical protein